MKPRRKVARKARKTPIKVAKKHCASPDRESSDSDNERTDAKSRAGERRTESETKKLQRLEPRSRMEVNRRKAEAKRRAEESKRRVCGENEGKSETLRDKRGGCEKKSREEEPRNETGNDGTGKSQKSEEKTKTEKQTPECKRRNDARRAEEDENEENSAEKTSRKRGKNPPTTSRKESGTPKRTVQKKPTRKTILAKKCPPPLAKKRSTEKRSKLVKMLNSDGENEASPRVDGFAVESRRKASSFERKLAKQTRGGVKPGGSEETIAAEPTNDESLPRVAEAIKREICEDEADKRREEDKKTIKSRPKMVKKSAKRKGTIQRDEESDESSTDRARRIDDSSDAPVKMDLKVEVTNGESGGEASPTSASDSEDNYVDEIESRGRGKQRNMDRARVGKEERDGSDERARGMRLFGFWSGPKRHRVASLNALAKVHCLYENEAGGVYLGGFCKPKPDNQKPKKAAAAKEEDGPKIVKKKASIDDTDKSVDGNKRNLRNVPGLRGKHWDMIETSSSSSDEDSHRETAQQRLKKRNATRPKKIEQPMDLKDMVVCKRMASLNASAILAASYSDEKNRHGSSSSSDTSSESEVEVTKRRKQQADAKSANRRAATDTSEDKSANKVVIVNQDTDVTITGVYVNQTRSTHHEGFCSIAGMQYRISSTSHTQTAATAVAAELHEQQKPEQPCKSYTPLGALSSMQPPGSQVNHPNASPRRHSAFTAPHQHGYYQPAGPLIQHPPTLPPVKAPPPEPTPTPPQNSEGSDDLVATSTTSGGTNSTGGVGFYRAYCPQYYGTPPQYQELCYPPTYPHSHPPPYYKYAPTYRRQYYGYPGGEGGGGTGGGGAVEYQSPPQPGEYPMPPYYGAYPPPPPPLPPPPNPAYLHAQGRPMVDHATFQGCPCPMQSCPKNVDTGPLIGNGKGAPVASGPGLSLPPSALVGPPSPARGLAGLAPPHGANAWDTDRVQPDTRRSNSQSQRQTTTADARGRNSDCRTKNQETRTEEKLDKCNCQKRACTSTCEVKLEAPSPTSTTSSSNRPIDKQTVRDFKLDNNNVKCESCSVGQRENISCSANCNVKCETGYKCEIIKCEQCIKEGEMTMMDTAGIKLMDDERLAPVESGVKEELNDAIVAEARNWRKPDYEPIAREVRDDEIIVAPQHRVSLDDESPKCRKLTKRKLSLDSLSDLNKKRKVDKRTLSLGSTTREDSTRNVPSDVRRETEIVGSEGGLKKSSKKDSQKRRNETAEAATRRAKINKKAPPTGNGNIGLAATESSINETIDDVIQQGLQMPPRRKKTIAVENKKLASIASTKLSRKIDLARVAAAEKLSPLGSEDAREAKCRKSENKLGVANKINDIGSKSRNNGTEEEIKGTKEITRNIETTGGVVVGGISTIGKNRVIDICRDVSVKRAALVRKKRKSTKTACVKRFAAANTAGKPLDIGEIVVDGPAKRAFLKPKWSNGWSWEGDSYEAKVYLTNDESAMRRCYAGMTHVSGDVLRPRDCVLLKSGQRKADLPFVAKIAALWENPEDGEMMFSLLWYYRPEHTEQGRTDCDTEDEVFASRHRDANSVACIEDKCYILTFNEYCRYRKNLRRIEEGLESPGLIVPPGEQGYTRESRQPPIPVPSDMVLFCRRVYDYRGKKLVKNPG